MRFGSCKAVTRFARVQGMSDSSPDPSGNTEQFRAFVQRDTEPSQPSRSNTTLIVAAAVAAVVVVAVLIYLLAS